MENKKNIDFIIKFGDTVGSSIQKLGGLLCIVSGVILIGKVIYVQTLWTDKYSLGQTIAYALISVVFIIGGKYLFKPKD